MRVPLASIISATEYDDVAALNIEAETDPSVIDAIAGTVVRLHAENHTQDGEFRAWAGARHKGAAATTLAQKLTAAGVKVSQYGHGSYVMQARFDEAPDLEANYPLAIAVFNPGWPHRDRPADQLTVTDTRDERDFEAPLHTFWQVRAPAGSEATIAQSITGDGDPPGSSLSFEDSFESGLSNWGMIGAGGSTVTAPVRHGSRALRVVSASEADGVRLQAAGIAEDESRFYRFSVFIPEDFGFEPNDTFAAVARWMGTTAYGPNVALRINDEQPGQRDFGWTLDIRGGQIATAYPLPFTVWLYNVRLGEWTDVELRVRWSSSAGDLVIFINGVECYGELNVLPNKWDVYTGWWDLGLFREGSTNQTTLYFDNVRWGVLNADPTKSVTAHQGNQCLAVTRGPTVGQLVTSTGVLPTTAHRGIEGMKLTGSYWGRPLTNVRERGAEIRWMDKDGVLIDTAQSTHPEEFINAWRQFSITATAPAGTAWWALQDRVYGPPLEGETHYIDTARTYDYAGTLSQAIDDETTTIYVRSAELRRPLTQFSNIDLDTNTITVFDHDLNDGDMVYPVGLDLPSGLTAEVPVYVIDATANSFRLSATEGGEPISLGSTGSGLRYVTKAPQTWPYRAPRDSDPIPDTTTTSTSTAECVHWVRVDDEIMAIVAVSGPTAGIIEIEVVRGMWGTTPVAHTADTPVLSPVYVGSISEGNDAGLAGSPQVNDPAKPLRYVLAVEQRNNLPQKARATEWLAKRRMMQYAEYDWADNPNSVPQSTDPAEWSGYTDAAAHNLSTNAIYLDITGNTFYNQADSYGYDAHPWSLVGVPEADHPGGIMTFQSLARAQSFKLPEIRATFEAHGYTDVYLIGNNLAAQSNDNDAEKTAIIADGNLDLPVLEFWVSDPANRPNRYKAQFAQWMGICRDGFPALAWAKSFPTALAGTTFDSDGSGTVTAAEQAHYRRWAFGHFLLGWRGSDKQQFASEWGPRPHDTIPLLFRHDYGTPAENYDTVDDIPTLTAGVYYRLYTSGMVVVNATASPVEVELPLPFRDLNDNERPIVSTVTIPAWDAGFYESVPQEVTAPLLRPVSLPQPSVRIPPEFSSPEVDPPLRVRWRTDLLSPRVASTKLTVRETVRR